MTDPAEDENPNNEAEGDAPEMHVVTPFGTFQHVDDLPPFVRHGLQQLIDHGALPRDAREVLSRALNTPTADESNLDDPDTQQPGLHGPDCTCEEEHRAQVWNILDTAFPDEPHLWQAAAALFELSAINPVVPDETAREVAIATAIMHLRRHAELNSHPDSPVEQIISDFRKQMGGL